MKICGYFIGNSTHWYACLWYFFLWYSDWFHYNFFGFGLSFDSYASVLCWFLNKKFQIRVLHHFRLQDFFSTQSDTWLGVGIIFFIANSFEWGSGCVLMLISSVFRCLDLCEMSCYDDHETPDVSWNAKCSNFSLYLYYIEFSRV